MGAEYDARGSINGRDCDDLGRGCANGSGVPLTTALRPDLTVKSPPADVQLWLLSGGAYDPASRRSGCIDPGVDRSGGRPGGSTARQSPAAADANAGAQPFPGTEMFEALLDGQAGIDRIVDDLVARNIKDPRIADIFKASDRAPAEDAEGTALLHPGRRMRLHGAGHEAVAR